MAPEFILFLQAVYSFTELGKLVIACLRIKNETEKTTYYHGTIKQCF